MKRKIFRSLVSVEEAERILSGIELKCEVEYVGITEAYGRVLAEDVYSSIDLPPFDRAMMDGFAVKAEDTFDAKEDNPVVLKVIGRVEAGQIPDIEVRSGEAAEISTGALIPKGANAVVMVEYTSMDEKGNVFVYKSVPPMTNISSAGSDIMAGELLLRKGTILTSKEIGILASVGINRVRVFKKPVVAIISTGNELKDPGEKLEIGKIYDVNSYVIYSGVIENGGIPVLLGIARDNEEEIRKKIVEGLKIADIVVVSGGTSAGVGDMIYRILEEFGRILIHGIAVKPGKPTVIALSFWDEKNKIIFGLPGYPVSAMMIFELFVAPLIRRLAGVDKRELRKVKAKAPIRIFSEVGRRELMPVSLVKGKELMAYPFTDYSGSVSALIKADGFIEIPEERMFIEEGEEVLVHLFGDLKLADLVIIGSHCVGIDLLLEILCKRKPLSVKTINVGSTNGISAIKRGEADIAGTHLLDEETNEYNVPFVVKYGLRGQAVIVKGYEREQGFIVRKNNPKNVEGFEDLLRDDITFINRNKGSGTRVLIDMNLKKIAEEKGVDFDVLKRRIRGYDVEAKTHTAVAVAVLMGKADVGVGIKTVADRYGLDFIPIRSEEYDFVIRRDRLEKESVKLFLEVLKSDDFRREVERRLPGIKITERTGEIINI